MSREEVFSVFEGTSHSVMFTVECVIVRSTVSRKTVEIKRDKYDRRFTENPCVMKTGWLMDK